MKNHRSQLQWLLALAMAFVFSTALLQTTGCKSVTDPNTGDVTVVFDADLAADLANTAAAITAYTYTKDHHPNGVWFRAVAAKLKAEADKPDFSPTGDTLQAVIESTTIGSMDPVLKSIVAEAVGRLYRQTFQDWVDAQAPPGDMKKVVLAIADGFELGSGPAAAAKLGARMR